MEFLWGRRSFKITKLEKVLTLGNYNQDSLLSNNCPMDFGMRSDTSLCPTGCKKCWNEEYKETE